MPADLDLGTDMGPMYCTEGGAVFVGGGGGGSVGGGGRGDH